MKTIQFYADVTKVGLPFIEIKDEGLHGRDVFKGIDLTTLVTI